LLGGIPNSGGVGVGLGRVVGISRGFGIEVFKPVSVPLVTSVSLSLSPLPVAVAVAVAVDGPKPVSTDLVAAVLSGPAPLNGESTPDAPRREDAEVSPSSARARPTCGPTR
jgi:hypothetical protein